MSETVGQCPVCGHPAHGDRVCNMLILYRRLGAPLGNDLCRCGMTYNGLPTTASAEPFITESELENGPPATNQPNMHSKPMRQTDGMELSMRWLEQKIGSMRTLIGQRQDEVSELRAKLEAETDRAESNWNAIERIKATWAEDRAKLEAAEKERSRAQEAAIDLAKKLSWANMKAALFPEMLKALKECPRFIHFTNSKDCEEYILVAGVIAKAEALERGTPE